MFEARQSLKARVQARASRGGRFQTKQPRSGRVKGTNCLEGGSTKRGLNKTFIERPRSAEVLNGRGGEEFPEGELLSPIKGVEALFDVNAKEATSKKGTADLIRLALEKGEPGGEKARKKGSRRKLRPS